MAPMTSSLVSLWRVSTEPVRGDLEQTAALTPDEV